MSSVDVVIPCYNYGRYLGECVASVLSQEGVETRVLVIDNASEDDSLVIARTLAERDGRVEVIAHERNMGATYSYNEGIDWAASDYFLILDADDVLAPGALARAAAVLDANPQVVFVFGDEGRIESSMLVAAAAGSGDFTTIHRPGGALISDLCRVPVNVVGANTVVRRTDAQKRIGHYRAELPYTDDLEMWLRLATLGEVVRIGATQALRRYHESRMSVHFETQARDFRERERAFESFFANEGMSIGEAPELLAQARRGLGEHAYWSAVSNLVQGRWTTAAELLALSRRWRPDAALLPPFRWLLTMDRPLKRAADILMAAAAALAAAGLRPVRNARSGR